MNKKELYLRRQHTARRGGYKKRVNVPLFKLQKQRQIKNPKYWKWGDLGHIKGESHVNTEFYLHKQEARKDAHDTLRKASTLNKNFRRSQNPIKHRRKYWKKEREEL